MDLENFDEVDWKDAKPVSHEVLTTKKALRLLDAHWYTSLNRRARWMDLIGDYAGSEPFVIDGNALISLILDDPLLAIGVEQNCSFQILHAQHSLERYLEHFLSRNAVFEIVFWESTTPATLLISTSSFVLSSRTLARTLLKEHLSHTPVPVHTFTGPDDGRWHSYARERKPMFVMTNDGGLTSGDYMSTERVLSQRLFIFDVLRHNIAVSMLKGSEFRNSKIFSFIYEPRLATLDEAIQTQNFKTASSSARQRLVDEYQKHCVTLSPPDGVLTLETLSNDDVCLAIGNLYLFHRSRVHDAEEELLYFFIAHHVLLDDLSVHERARGLDSVHPTLEACILQNFFPLMFQIIGSVVAMRHCPFDVDGRLFVGLIAFVVGNPTLSLSEMLGTDVHTRIELIWRRLDLPPPDLDKFRHRFPPVPGQPKTTHKANTLRLLPFDNEVFNAELSQISVDVDANDISLQPDTSSSYLNFGQDVLFSDTQHWHNQKPLLPTYLGGKKVAPADPWLKRKMLRRNQQFMSSLQRQAGTLTGASGAALEPMVIPMIGLTEDRKTAKTNPAKSKIVVKSGKKGKEPVMKSADKLRAAILETTKKSQGTASQSWWQLQVASLEMMTIDQRLAHLDTLDRNKRSAQGPTGAEMRLYRVHNLLLRWIAETNREDPTVCDRYAVSILRLVKDILGRPVALPSKFVKALSSAVVAIGFQDYVPSMLQETISDAEETAKLAFSFVKLVKSKTNAPLYDFMRIREDPAIWQLRAFGDYMDRSMDGRIDNRVGFTPDAWQIQVLDAIDRKESLLVVAPTSAGKTFISFYAMEQILRASDNGILVYIAPTKALVTQIAAEIYARFSKDLNGKSCWAVHTREWRINEPLKCQILVTVPEMLATMLLSPALARVWSSRIQRIILDEIHTIGQQDGGAVWEQIILLAPCPIIGLSATIGDPEIFSEWLRSVQTAHGFEYTYISHPHRYSHLRKFFYALKQPPPSSFVGLSVQKNSERTRHLHPIAMLSFGARLLPSDLALESADTLSLYKAMRVCGSSIDLRALEPSTFFASKSLIRQKDVINYESELKQALADIIARSNHRDPQSALNKVICALEDPVLSTDPAQQGAAPSKAAFMRNMIFMVSDLHASGDLPAILFNFDRTECEIIAQRLVQDLERAEEMWRETSAEWQCKLSQWEAWKLKAKEREKLAERASKQKKREDESEQGSSQERSWESSFDPSEPTEQFSFAGIKTAYSKVDLEEDIRKLRWAIKNSSEWIFDALRRGIAVHHSGMNKHYQSLIESLFRQGFVRVMIATGTLALGINAPTKTAVFCGDSPFLTALMYRQCSGRAGRRGYDPLGKVLFYGLPMEKVQRLILSRLPSLSGNFPLTSTLCLRLFNLLDGSQYSPLAVNAIKSILNLPQISFGSTVGQHQLLHHVRFSIDYLRRARLLDGAGHPLNLFPLSAHLYYTEPSNFAVVTLFQKGVFHRVCKQPSASAAKKELIHILAHLFGRRYIHQTYTSGENIQMITKRYPSMVVLPPLPRDALNVLWEHDKEILQIFTAYAMTYSSQYDAKLGEDNRLPLSKREFKGSAACYPFRDHLKASAIPLKARSPFVANSGQGDIYKSIRDLVRTARQGLHLNEHAIPSFAHLVATPGKGEGHFALNAYLLDFYIHGQVKTLEAANGIRRGDVWYLLGEFNLTLKTIKTSLYQLLIEASEKVPPQPTTGRSHDALSGGSAEETDEMDVDSGYASYNPAEADHDDEDDEASGQGAEFKRLEGVRDLDWKVFKLISEASSEFEEKFRVTWA